MIQPSTFERYRLVTRSDFDGLVCAVLLKRLGMLDEILFVHPKDMQDGKIEIGPRDITTNLPYVPGAFLAVDHHHSEELRAEGVHDNHVIDAGADSAARVLWRHLGGKDAFPDVSDELLEAVDKADTARFSVEEILDPQGWVLLNFLMDPRTGLGRFRDFRVSNYQLMMQLIDSVLELGIDEILKTPDVQERVELYRAHRELAVAQIRRCARVEGHVVVLDLRGEETIYATNRFMIYALFPQANISIHVMWGMQNHNTVLACGKSILDRSSRTNVGELMLAYGGGGHMAAGTCQVANGDAEVTLAQLIKRINLDG
jgi:nanoRNase/pAp phosphatase (c-di-AMP/oligoRNAs hydrolase)